MAFVVLMLLAASSLEAQFTNNAWTGDATAGTSSDTNIWAYRFNASTNATVNGVTFTAVAGGSPTVSGKFSLTPTTGTFANDTNDLTALTGTGSAVLAQSFVYGGYPATLTLQGLTVGTVYRLSVYTVGFDLSPTVRESTWTSGSDSAVLDCDKFGNNKGNRINYVFTATATTRDIVVDPLVANQSWHFYGIALDNYNVPEIVVEGPAGGESDGWKREHRFWNCQRRLHINQDIHHQKLR